MRVAITITITQGASQRQQRLYYVCIASSATGATCCLTEIPCEFKSPQHQDYTARTNEHTTTNPCLFSPHSRRTATVTPAASAETETETEIATGGPVVGPNGEGGVASSTSKKKVALLISYWGSDYQGLQM